MMLLDSQVDIHAVKDALESAVEMMNCMENSVNFLLPKVIEMWHDFGNILIVETICLICPFLMSTQAEQTNALMSELAHCVTQERLLLEECSELLKQTSTLEVQLYGSITVSSLVYTTVFRSF